MAETLVSPGVLARENDQSFITQQPVAVGAAIVGPTVKGPVEIPTIVTSYSDYQNRFGTTFESGSEEFTFLTSISAYNYFQNGGDSLLVSRVVSGSSNWAFASASIEAADGVALVLEAIDQGVIFNNSGSTATGEIAGGNGALISGSRDNIRWEVATSSSSNGTFDLLIRRGDDNNSTKTVLETWSGLSMDPKADNYVARVIGDYKYEYDSTENYVKVTGNYPNASRYVRVKSVELKTPNYFDNAGNAKSTYTGSIPLQGSGSYAGTFDHGVGSLINAQGANNMFNNISDQTQGLTGSDYTNMLNLLANQDDYQFNVLVTPGLLRSKHASETTTALSNVQSRGDALYVIDPSAYGSAITGTDSPVEEAATINSSYGAMYWPWLQTSDPDTGDNVWVPASTMIPGVYAFNDNASEPWFAPAGINRGGLNTVIRPERKLSSTNRDTLYTAKVNPIASFPGVGTVVYGQKTLQKQASALDRVNVRRLLIELKGYISQISQTLVFEQNTAATRNNFLSQVNPYLESVQQRQGLYAFKVVMDDSNNTPDVVDRNQLVGQIFLQPTKTAEFILLDFNVLPTGATFPA
jgi:phage tail sheath protein FI